MAEIRITVKDHTPELMQKLEAAIGRFVRKGAGYVKGQLVTKIAAAKSGRRYGSHIASAPGEAPASDSGNLIGSITEIFPSTLEAKIGTPVEYALYLEEGTSRMEPRPLWDVTAKESLPTLERMLKAEIRGVH
jgi:hypothetical protein